MADERKAHLLAALAVGAAAFGVTPDARADVSSWLFVGAGPSVFDYSLDGERQLSLDLATGLGSPPSHDFIVGGLVRALPHLGDGTDLSLAVRLATHGYVNGGLGVAVDAGAYRRFWGAGSTGWIGTLSGGLPWGFVLNVSVAGGTNDTRMALATFGIDFARLTVYRTAGQSWWSNPFPAVREESAR